jgi:hypothetical protein
LKVIGAGLGRTATFSLKFALEHLGFGPCYHMTEVFAGARRNILLAVAEGSKGAVCTEWLHPAYCVEKLCSRGRLKSLKPL